MRATQPLEALLNDDAAKFEAILSALGKPHCRGERYAIFRMDCLEGLDAIPAKSIDLTVTSPPYNIGKEYEKTMLLTEYVDWCQKWFKKIHISSKDNGAFWLNIGYISIPEIAKAIPLPYLLWDKIPFFLVQEVVWNYGAGVAAKKFLSPRNEKLLWYVKNENDYTFNLDDIRDPDVKYPNQKKNGKLRCNAIGKNPSDVWQIAKVTSGANRSSKERAPHPAQFPIDMVDRIIRGFSNSNEIVLDPFMGSGTTAECCVRNGRYAIGFEINEDYCDYASERLATSENDLFSGLKLI